MAIFKRKGDEEVLDLTDMQRRGLLQKAAEIEKQFAMQKKDSSGYFDFTGASSSSGTIAEASPTSYSSGGTGSQFDFLDALASTSGGSSGASVNSSSSGAGGVNSLEIQGLKNKIDDLEYKLRVLEDKVAGLGS